MTVDEGQTVAKGLFEQEQNEATPPVAATARRGRQRSENKNPQLAIDIRLIVDPSAKEKLVPFGVLILAPDWSTLSRVRDCVRTALAWGSIVDDVKDGRLNIDRLQENQAKKELATAEDVLPRVARECYGANQFLMDRLT